MERMHASEIFSTPKHSKEFLDSLDYSDFKKWLSFVNGVERGIPKLERGKVSDSKVLSEGALTGTEVEYKPPHKDYSDKLLQIAFKKAQSIEDSEIAAFNFGVFY